MKNLENIPKMQIFEVPEGYFDSLPTKIQARISGEKPIEQPGFAGYYKLQYILPVIALLAVGVYWFLDQQDPRNAESILASVRTEELVAYLGDSELTTDDLLEGIQLNAEDVHDIESEVYELNLGHEDLEEMFGDLDIENL